MRTKEEALEFMKYTLTQVYMTAECSGVYAGIEPHQKVTKAPEGLTPVGTLEKASMPRINSDTGNEWMGGENPYEGLRLVGRRLIQLRGKDIDASQSEKEPVVVWGTPTGSACGKGVIDWSRVIAILGEIGYDEALSAEFGAHAQERRSLQPLPKLFPQLEQEITLV